ncbi:MAG TPA: hypothetical protein VK139_04855 [Microbacteriaceae bacterium]|nr:hypothetical protein [Microbacteriaceae bacterium]
MTQRPQRVPGMRIDYTTDGAFVTNPTTGLVTWLNRTGAMIYLLANGQHDAHEISEAIRHLFQLFQNPRRDVDEALGELARSGLVRDVESPEDLHLAVSISLWAPEPSIPRDALEAIQSITAQFERAEIPVRLLIERSRNVTLVRNRAASAVVSYAQFSHHLFLDASAEATAAAAAVDLVRIVRSGHGVVGIPVPLPNPDWNRVATSGLDNPIDLQNFAQSFAISFAGIDVVASRADDFVDAAFTSASALLVSRAALEELAGSPTVRRYRGLIADNMIEYHEHMWGFFDFAHMEGDFVLSDEVSFCHRWRGLGHPVKVDVTGLYGKSIDASRKVVGRLRAASRS